MRLLVYSNIYTYNYHSVKKLIQTIKNIWSIEELRGKIIVTLTLILIYRVGVHIVLPGIDPNKLQDVQSNASSNGLLGLFDTFAGGAFSHASIFALGVMVKVAVRKLTSGHVILRYWLQCCNQVLMLLI